jgi:hypothetical protein
MAAGRPNYRICKLFAGLVQIGSGMSFFTKKLTGQEIGQALFEHDQKTFLAGYPGRLFPADTLLDKEVVKVEWLYFDASNIDYFALLVFGDTAERGAIMMPYWASMKKWLDNKTVMPGVGARVWNCRGAKQIPKEPKETGWQRMQRRLMMYAAAIHTPHQLGECVPVSTLFCGLCGSSEISFSLGVGQFYSSKKAEQMKFFESYRSTPSPVPSRHS